MNNFDCWEDQENRARSLFAVYANNFNVFRLYEDGFMKSQDAIGAANEAAAGGGEYAVYGFPYTDLQYHVPLVIDPDDPGTAIRMA